MAAADEHQVGSRVPQQRQRSEHVRLPLVPIELPDDREQRRVEREPELSPDPRERVRLHRRWRVVAGIQPDPRHVHESPGRDDVMPAGGLLVLVADHDQAVGPAACDALRGQERGIRQQVAGRMEMEAMRGVGDERPALDGHPAHDVARQEAGDRRVDVDDVGRCLEDPEQRASGPREPANVEQRSRERQLVDSIERVKDPGIARGAVGGGLDAPAERPKVGCIRGEERPDRARDRGDDEQRGLRGWGGGGGRRSVLHRRRVVSLARAEISADQAVACANTLRSAPTMSSISAGPSAGWRARARLVSPSSRAVGSRSAGRPGWVSNARSR